MNNREKFLSGLDEEVKNTLAKVFDKAQAAKKIGRPMFTDFLSEREYGEFLTRQKNADEVPFTSFGGFSDASRVMLCFSTSKEDFPIRAVLVKGKGVENLKHPDLLGSIMSLGIERRCVGDIVRLEEGWAIFLETAIQGFVVDSLKEVGGVYVQCEETLAENVKINHRFEEITATVSSLRADSVVAVMLKTSRSKAADYITGQKFFLNQVLCTKCDKEIKENDILTVRHHGKARVGDVGGVSKKGRIFITIQKYI